MQSPQSAPLRTMVVRVSVDDIILYANGALCSYFGLKKQDVIGASLSFLADRAQGEIATCFARPTAGRTRNHLVTDETGRVFEAKLYSDGGVLDIALDEVTHAESVGREIRSSSGTPFELLNEEELRTVRQPERRYITVSFTRLCGLSDVGDHLAPMELRLMVNSFIEEAGDAIMDVGGTIGETMGDSILGIHGAPRHYADHPLRAILAACAQQRKAAALHDSFLRGGKELPPCSAGLWTGDTLVGTLGNSVWQHYTALGKPVELARRLAELARPGEILLPEHTLTHLLRVLPDGWSHLRAGSEHPPDLSDFVWSGEDVAPVPEHLQKVVYLIGPDVAEHPERVELYLDYLWCFRVPGRDQLVPILRAVQPSQAGDSLELGQDNVVTGQAVQTLGKYKLLEVIGVGGMGRVWRGVDRFGNAVAIKVLHASESVNESQLKRFHREAEIMARLPHRNICRVYEMSEYEGIQFLAMEFVNGLTLSDVLYEKTTEETRGTVAREADLPALIRSIRVEKVRKDRETTVEGESVESPPRPEITRILPFAQTINVVIRICDAVQFAHEHGVLHRDLKPGNILLREDGEPLVADFGLAKLRGATGSQSLSVSGHVVGTFENMSPEQAESSKDVDERADVYSIGTILYQMITGHRHFRPTGNIVNDAQALKLHEPPRPRSYNPNIDADLEIITLKALRTDPAERYRSVAALAADLDRYRRGDVILAKPLTALDLVKKLIQRNRAVAAVTAVSVFIFICGTLLAITILSRQLTRAQIAQREAEQQRMIAEEQRGLAEQQRLAAEKSRIEAKQREDEAKTAHARIDDLNREAGSLAEASKEVSKARDLAAAETEVERKRREELEQKLAELEKMREEQAALPNLVAEEPPKSHTRRLSAEDRQNLRTAFERAQQILFFELAPLELDRMDKRPDEVVARFNRAMDAVSEALLIDRENAPAWMLKGRMHLAFMEFDAATAAFAAAEAAPKEADLKDDPSRMKLIAGELARSMGDRVVRASQLLTGTDLPRNESTLALLRYYSDKSRKAAPGEAIRSRNKASNEIALSLYLLNPDVEPPRVTLDQMGAYSADLRTNGELKDLSPLRNINLTSLKVVGATTLDWSTILMAPLESLDLSDCDLVVIPYQPRALNRLRSLRLARTSLNSIEIIRQMPLLESLDITETNVSDLLPLGSARRLRHLEMGSLNPANLRILLNVPVESLVLSPEAIEDQLALQSLRGHRTLKMIGLPGQNSEAAADFWQKFDVLKTNSSTP